jgi:Fur family transcriptional regulator, stress-responsive regulator
MTPAQDPDPRDLLRAVGLRVTAPRVAVMKALAAQPHSTADEVVRRVRQSSGPVSTQAVYDILRACVGAGLVRRVELTGPSARYEMHTGDNHHHLVCRTCGAIADVDCVLDEIPCLKASNTAGFDVEQTEVVFWGTCSKCRERQPTTMRR